VVEGMTRHRALISTIVPIDGGVPTMTRWIVSLLQDMGIEPVFAWYEPWSTYPYLSVPVHALATGRSPGRTTRSVYGHHQGYGIGAWLPELEFTHYLPRRNWRDLIEQCQFHLAVTGNPLCATPFVRLGLPFLAWVATPWEADRRDRVKGFSMPRRLLDRGLNRPLLRGLERQILRSPHGRILALSGYTSRSLAEIAQRPMDGVMLMPVDSTTFHPVPHERVPWTVGFSGRYGDPRKGVGLLLEAVRALAREDSPIRLELIGEKDSTCLRSQIETLGLADRVVCHSPRSGSELARVVRRWDLFVIPSHQEGLCIAALEAMACGIPVVSTTCGGPEDYVLPDRTGELVARDPQAMARAIASICADPERRRRLGEGAARWVRDHASPQASRAVFRHHFHSLYPLLTS
jgi:glycosyltransferase involved in cell wall biosynthesis